MSDAPHNPAECLGLVLLPRFSMFSVSALLEPLRIANYCRGETLYAWEFLSADGADVQSSTAMTLRTRRISKDDAGFRWVLVCGGWNTERYASSVLNGWLQHQARRGAILGATETGSYVLAQAGLLQGHQATIHWHCLNAFRERYPGIEARDALFVLDRQRMTCAGGAAGTDMMLHEIRRAHGDKLAQEVADQLVFAPLREAGQAQRKARGRPQPAIPPALQRAIELMEQNVEKPLRIPQISRRLGFSQRKLERLFHRHFGCSAVAYYRNVRLQEARVLLTHTDMSVLDVCIACGFASSSYFSKIYTQQFGLHPRDHRTAWPDEEPAPRWPGIGTGGAAGL